jgi:hypothetical protein
MRHVTGVTLKPALYNQDARLTYPSTTPLLSAAGIIPNLLRRCCRTVEALLSLLRMKCCGRPSSALLLLSSSLLFASSASAGGG